MNTSNKVSILGCGHGGVAIAADLKSKGAEVAIWSDKSHAQKFSFIKQKGEIVFIEQNKLDHGRVTFDQNLISYDLKETLKFGDVIYNCLPNVAHVPIFKKVVDILSLDDKPKLFINISGIFSAIDQFLQTKDRGIFNRIKVFDSSTCPYACRAGNDNTVKILGRKNVLPIAPLFYHDRCYLDSLPECCKPANFEILKNCFESGFSAIRVAVHSATALTNLGKIDRGEPFLFYKDGMTKKTSLLAEVLDQERLVAAKAMGYDVNTAVEEINKYYGTAFVSLHDISANPAYAEVLAPTTTNHRYITGDIPFNLVPLLALGKLYGLELKNISTVINILSICMETDYFANGRNLSSLTKNIIDKLSKCS